MGCPLPAASASAAARRAVRHAGVGTPGDGGGAREAVRAWRSLLTRARRERSSAQKAVLTEAPHTWGKVQAEEQGRAALGRPHAGGRAHSGARLGVRGGLKMF